MECTITELFKDGRQARPQGRVSGAFGYWRETGRFVAFKAPSVILATGGIGKSFKVTSNSWEYTGDGHALALRAGAALLNMEFVQFHPTGMVWPPSVKGILVTESVRGDGGILRNSEGKRFMFDYIPEFFKAETADTEAEADRWYDDKANNRRPPELLPRDEVARAINSEIKAGRGSEHGGIYLDIASRRTPEFIRKRLPSMYHQFKELADVDITAEPMEIGPTCHYVMGGVEVDADTRHHPWCPVSMPPVRSPAACTAPTGSVATRCPTCWSSASALQPLIDQSIQFTRSWVEWCLSVRPDQPTGFVAALRTAARRQFGSNPVIFFSVLLASATRYSRDLREKQLESAELEMHLRMNSVSTVTKGCADNFSQAAASAAVVEITIITDTIAHDACAATTALSRVIAARWSENKNQTSAMQAGGPAVSTGTWKSAPAKGSSASERRWAAVVM